MSPRLVVRMSAYLIDLTASFLCSAAVIGAVGATVTGVFDFPLPLKRELLASYKESLFLLTASTFFLSLLYSNYFLRGRSLGCLFLDLKVKGLKTDENGDQRPLSFLQSVVRSFVQVSFLFSTFLIPLLFLPLMRKDKKSLADLFSSSLSSVDDGQEKAPSETKFPLPTLLEPPPVPDVHEEDEDDQKQAA